MEGLVGYYESDAVGARVVILSEYAISRVERPVYLNRVLRAEGLVQVRTENGGETLDCGECRAFALCDHQVRVLVVYVSSKRAKAGGNDGPHSVLLVYVVPQQ